MTWGKRLCFCLWAFCLFLGGNEVGRAADWVVTPSIETRAEYLSNIYYSPRLKKSDYIVSAVPKLEFTYNTERTQIGGSLRLEGSHYFQNPNLDNIDQFYNIIANTMPTARLKFNLTGMYISTTRSTQAIDVTNLFTIRQRTNYISLSPGLSYFFTERLSTELSYTFNNIEYQYNPFRNYSTHGVSSRLNYLFNEKTTFILSVGANYSQYQKTKDNIISFGPQIGFNRKITEKMDITILGGANFSRRESTVASDISDNFIEFNDIPQVKTEQTNSINPFITIAANFHWERRGITFNYTRNESPSAYGSQSQYNYFNLSYFQNITEKLKLTINPYFNITSLESGVNNSNEQYYYGIRQKITYNLTEKASIGVNYNFAYKQNTGIINNSFPIHDIYVFLNYSYPLHFQR